MKLNEKIYDPTGKPFKTRIDGQEVPVTFRMALTEILGSPTDKDADKKYAMWVLARKINGSGGNPPEEVTFESHDWNLIRELVGNVAIPFIQGAIWDALDADKAAEREAKKAGKKK